MPPCHSNLAVPKARSPCHSKLVVPKARSLIHACCREQAPPILQDCNAYTRQKAELELAVEQGREWRQKKFMPDPLLAAALDRVNQMERENPTRKTSLREK